jgi:UDP-N-acetylmuramoylalanine--D-glutamate ligase
MMEPTDLNFTGKKVVIVGLGVSGLCTAQYMAARGAEIILSDNHPEAELDPERVRLTKSLGARLETGGHDKETFLKADVIVISPGVPHNMGILLDARRMGIPVFGELELASRLIHTPIISITGTNGKSTVTEMIGFLLKSAGFKVFVGGNIGTPLMAYAAGTKDADYAVVEASSFQLDTIETFRPLVSVILNISPDHLDRYADYEDYAQSKLKIFSNQTSGCHVVLNDADERLGAVNPQGGVSVLRYGSEKKDGRHAYIQDKEIIVEMGESASNRFSVESYRLPGRHNQENLMAVVLAAQALDIDSHVIRETISEFKGLPNRIEYVRTVEGVAFYNDSKATNVDSAVRAVTSLDRPVILIAGGRHKGADYEPLVKQSEDRVKRAILMGESKDLLAGSFEGRVPFEMAKDMEEAVNKAFAAAGKGDAVLLAPACSSFDMFSDYSHRGRVFRSIVDRLNHG